MSALLQWVTAYERAILFLFVITVMTTLVGLLVFDVLRQRRWRQANSPIDDTARLDALRRWLCSADLKTGLVTFHFPGLADLQSTTISKNVRWSIDLGIAAEERSWREYTRRSIVRPNGVMSAEQMEEAR